jgi:lysophospholipase L1-like esterase
MLGVPDRGPAGNGAAAMRRTLAAVALAVLAITGGMGASCAPEVGTPRVLLIGDSLSVGARDQGELGATDAAGWTVDAQVNRGTNVGVATASSYDVRSFDVVVVALGTNDYLDDKSTYGVRIDNMMKVLGKTTPVIWVNVDAGEPRLGAAALGVNPAIASAPLRHRNLTAADWSSFVGARWDLPGLRATDGIHYTKAGYDVRARGLESLVVRH